jgi:hypothetical protein
MLTQPVIAKDGIQKLMRKRLASLLVGVHPFLQNRFLDSPHRLTFRNASVSNPVQMLIQQGLLVFTL